MTFAIGSIGYDQFKKGDFFMQICEDPKNLIASDSGWLNVKEHNVSGSSFIAKATLKQGSCDIAVL